MVKGAAVRVEGKPVFNVYVNKKTGESSVNVTVFADSVALACHDKKEYQHDNECSRSDFESGENQFETGYDYEDGYDFESEGEDGIPF